jgi:ABC-type multidrug transport system fused ATPase/permease subunit
MFFNAVTNIWITYWTELPEDNQPNEEGYTYTHYLNFYILFGVLYGTFAFFRAILIAVASPKMSLVIHEAMISNLLFSSLNEFFDRVPLGRILNRLSKDMNSIDTNLPALFANSLVFIFFLLTNFLIILYCAQIWIFLPILVGYLIACYMLKNFYIKSSKEIVRL